MTSLNSYPMYPSADELVCDPSYRGHHHILFPLRAYLSIRGSTCVVASWNFRRAVTSNSFSKFNYANEEFCVSSRAARCLATPWRLCNGTVSDQSAFYALFVVFS